MKDKLEELKQLLWYVNYTISDNASKIIYGKDGKQVAIFDCFCNTKSGFRTAFHREFSNEKDLDNFKEDLKNAIDIKLLSDEMITMEPIISGGINDFYYYIDNKRIMSGELKNMSLNTKRKYDTYLLDKKIEFEKLFSDIVKDCLKKQDLENYVNERIKQIDNNIRKSIKSISENNIDELKLSIVKNAKYTLDMNSIANAIMKNDMVQVYNIFNTLKEKINEGVTIDFKYSLLNDSSSREYIMMNNAFNMLKNFAKIMNEDLKHNINIIQEKLFELDKMVSELGESKHNREQIWFSNKDKFNLELKDSKITTNELIEGINLFSTVNLQEKYDELSPENKMFETLDKKQQELLTKKEIIAINLYKTQLYRAFNPIIDYLRKNDIESINNAPKEKIDEFIQEAYNELKNKYQTESPFDRMHRYNSKKELIAEKIFQQYNDEMPTFNEYSKLIYEYLDPLLSSLQKVVTDDDIIVYRGIVNDYSNKNNTDIKNITSTTIDKEVASNFVLNRDINNRNSGIVYKIIIPKGTPVICFTNNIMKGDNSFGFNDDQHEIMFDANLLDFKVNDAEFEIVNKKSNDKGNEMSVQYITLEGMLKDNKHKQR